MYELSFAEFVRLRGAASSNVSKGKLFGSENELKDLEGELDVFLWLPLEMIREILHQCDPPTLWQLMRTSSMLRKEAMPLFWAHPSLWFRWIKMSVVSTQHIDPTAAPFIQQLDLSSESHEAFDTDYWAHLSKGFPSLKRVVFTNVEYDPRRGPEYDSFEVDPTSSFRIAMDSFPPDLELLVGRERNYSMDGDSSDESRNQEYMWMLQTNNWERFTLSCKMVKVEPPLPRDPLGSFSRFMQRRNLLLENMERQNKMAQLRILRSTGDHKMEQEVLKRMERRAEQDRQQKEHLWEIFGAQDSEKRKAYEEAFLGQLEEDAFCDRDVKDSIEWARLKMEMGEAAPNRAYGKTVIAILSMDDFLRTTGRSNN